MLSRCTAMPFGREIGLVAGFLLDIFSVRLFGINALLLAGVGWCVGRYSKKFYRESIITHALVIFTVSWFVASSYLLFMKGRGPSGDEYGILSALVNPRIIFSSFVCAMFGIWAYAFLGYVFVVPDYR